MSRKLFEKWKVESKRPLHRPWRVQCVNYVAHFASEIACDKAIAAWTVERKRLKMEVQK